ncbi:hypothetical protein TcG_04162 [Trypanosoma cruzi]|nr:hypothetical protein TcG_04162 [Trypanosoma cruzi]
MHNVCNAWPQLLDASWATFATPAAPDLSMQTAVRRAARPGCAPFARKRCLRNRASCQGDCVHSVTWILRTANNDAGVRVEDIQGAIEVPRNGTAHSPRRFREQRKSMQRPPNEARCCKRGWTGQCNTACRVKLRKEAYKHTKKGISAPEAMTSGPAQVGHRHQCPGVTGRHGFPNAALVVMPWATSPTRRAAVTVGGNELAHRAPGKDGTRPYSLRATALLGAPIAAGLCCGRRRRIACPAKSGRVHFYSLKWIRWRMNPTARGCVGELWKDTVLRSVI